jgi:AhpD family alkylhydroperoxidase
MTEPTQTPARKKLNTVNKGYLFAKNNLPDTITPYLQFSAKAKADGALPSKTKELILLGIALVTRCDGCLLHHMKECKKLGVTREEILETFGVAVMMGGGPVFTFAALLEEAMEEFYPVEKK